MAGTSDTKADGMYERVGDGLWSHWNMDIGRISIKRVNGFWTIVGDTNQIEYGRFDA